MPEWSIEEWRGLGVAILGVATLVVVVALLVRECLHDSWWGTGR